MARMHEVKDIPMPSTGTFETRCFPIREDLTGVTARDPNRDNYNIRFVSKEEYGKTLDDFSTLSGEAQRDIAAYAKEYCADRQKIDQQVEMRTQIQRNYPAELSKVSWESDQFLRVVNDHQNKNGAGFRDMVVEVKGRPIFASSSPSIYALHLGQNMSFAGAFADALARGDEGGFKSAMAAAGCAPERREAAVQAAFSPQP